MDAIQQSTEVKNNICNYLKEGLSKKDAAVMAGISEATFYRWIEEDESFESQVQASTLTYKHSLIKNITTCTAKDGRLALEVLSRRYPKEWGVKTGLEDEEGREERLRAMKELAEKLQKIYDKEREEKPENITYTFPDGQKSEHFLSNGINSNHIPAVISPGSL